MATPTVQFLHGSPTMVDHTPGSAVSGGDVVVTNDTPRIAHNDIAANELGALAVGGGVYKVPKATGSGTAIADDKDVYWDAGNDQATETASTHKKLGRSVKAASDDDTHVWVLHDPDPYAE